MKIIAVIVLCIVEALAKPNGYGAGYQQPDIRIESYDPPPPAYAPPMPKAYGYQSPPPIVKSYDAPAPYAPPMPKANYGYQSPPAIVKSYDAPAIRTDSYGQYGHTPTAHIVRQHVQSDNAGSYTMNVESSDGSTQTETGSLRNLGHPEGPTSVKQGAFAWTSPEGQRFSLTYTADENGFVAQGDHLPTSPPMPEEIRQSLLIPRTYEHDSYSSYAPASPPMSNYGGGYASPKSHY